MGAKPSENDVKVVADFLTGLTLGVPRRTTVADDDIPRIVRIIEARRIDLPLAAASAVRLAIKTDPSIASPLAAALFARLDAAPAPTAADHLTNDRRMEQIRIIAESIAQLPATAVSRFRPQVVALLRDRQRRGSAIPLLSRLDLYGSDIAPHVFAMMDDAAGQRDPRRPQFGRRGSWNYVWEAGAHSVCRMSAQLPANALDALRSRAAELAKNKILPGQHAVVTAMLRMGATEEDIKETLSIDLHDARTKNAFDAAARRSRREMGCG